jgi:RimJ/RimL family protein N-acetyltransferase
VKVMFYRSERLFLRPAFPEDAREIYEGICDAGVVQMLASVPWPYRLADAQEYCAKPHDARAPRFAVTLPSVKGAPIVGVVGFHPDGDGIGFGYWIARDHWGRGYATEAGRGALEVARALGHRRVSAGHYVDNPASGRVLRKLGFRETGEVRPQFCQARGGDLVLSRRYALELAEAGADAAASDDRMRAA